jgi:nickel superoxide dismutase
MLLLASPHIAGAHCQVPCGIYDDAARLEAMREDATTIEKALRNIAELSAKTDAQSANQLVRWIHTKEAHASHIIEVVSTYFLTQKVKPVTAGAEGRSEYLSKLADHHAVMTAAMKCKQGTTPELVDALRTALDALAAHYSSEGHEH